ncbi:MAG: RimK family alpha-L-glutamate ligase [Candidatus Lokiarchaeota archaeon]|nr:RimK family alpha-L-glutamate ligase [Candidatus Lokiarchaeota archaeon]
MNIGIVINTITFEARELINTAAKYFPDVKIELFKNDDFKFDITDDNGFKTDVDVFLQRSISMTRAVYTSFILEGYGYRVVSSHDTLSITEDKLKMTSHLKRHHVPTPRTMIAFTKETAMDAIHDLEYPVIIKPVSGSWGRLVAMLENDRAATAVLEDREELGTVYHKIYYLQDFVHKPGRSVDQYIDGDTVGRDIRAFVIGDEVASAMYRYEVPNDFRSNVTLGGRAEAYHITPELENIALKAARAVKGEIVGVDLMESDKGLVVVEVNGSPQFQGIMKSTGINIPKRILEYIIRTTKR